jgi:hypothetical protein
MKTMMVMLAFLTINSLPNICAAQSSKSTVKTLTTGNWSVERGVDTMSDKIICTGFHNLSRSAQLSSDRMYVVVSGGIQSVTLRFGEKPARGLRLARKLEMDVGAIILEGAEFAEVSTTARVRVQVLTLVKGLFTQNLDTTGIDEALKHIRSGCPAPTGNSKTHTAPAIKPLCNESLTSRLKVAGVTAAQIAIACGQ